MLYRLLRANLFRKSRYNVQAHQANIDTENGIITSTGLAGKTDAYAEYLDLIDQTPPIDETPVEEPAEPEEKPESLLTRIYKFIVKFLIECFNYIFPKV